MTSATLGKKKTIGEELVDANAITKGQLAEALAVQAKDGGTIVAILFALNYLTPTAVQNFIAAHRGIPSIELSKYIVPKNVVSFIPREFAVKHQICPIDKLGKTLTVGMIFPLDSELIAQIETLTSLRVKGFLCNADDIHRAIDHYYPPVDARANPILTASAINTVARIENIGKLVQKIDALPVLPETVRKVQEATQRADIDLKEIAGIVSQDPVISARLLKLANSPAYGFKNKVDDIDLTVSLLGVKEISMAVVSSAVINATESAGNFDCAAFSRRSMLCAGAARRIGAVCGFKKSPGIFTAGLLCEIGRFALAQCAPARYETISATPDDAALCSEEQKLFGVGHPEAGFLLAEHWELPADLTEPIRYHLTPERAQTHPRETAVIALAARLAEARMLGLDVCAQVLDPCQAAMARLDLSGEGLMAVYSELDSDSA